MIRSKNCGILLHISSLPSRFGIGDLGPGAYAFVDFLHETKQTLWQILPMTPTDPITGNSPYSCPSAFAGNPLFISPDLLVDDGYLRKSDLASFPDLPSDRVDYQRAISAKGTLFERAYETFKEKRTGAEDMEAFCRKEQGWLEDFAMFSVLKDKFNGLAWADWPAEFKWRDEGALKRFRSGHREEIDRIIFLQFLFFRQWEKLKDHCRRKQVRLIGDCPFYVNFDSADVWTAPGNFKLDENLHPTVVSGVPPDYFSPTGQRWGNPVYHWDNLKKSGYGWWAERLRHLLKYCDMVRVDHFRAFVNYWEIPAQEKTAVNGHWETSPTREFFNGLLQDMGPLPLIAEDLGEIDPNVRDQIDALGFPGMKILLFAFAGDLEKHMYLPHNFSSNCVVYTGTHDNNTVKGWYREEASALEQSNLERYLGSVGNLRDYREGMVDVPWQLIALAMSSSARLCVIPLQDILSLDGSARMNTPGTIQGNWEWRFKEGQIASALKERLKQFTEISGRASLSEVGGALSR